MFSAGDFSAELLRSDTLEALKEQLEREYILRQLDDENGDSNAVARLLGISRRQLYRRLRKLGIRLREERKRRR